ncbi:MAG: TRAP transporter substrate-binding protein [Gammaproteobacteria bacterium]|nr:TRAP transporter substrate-binding protein [Gammaproteobacteria bacterium]
MKYLAKFITMIVALGAVMLPGQASAEKVMRVGSWLPPKHTMNKDVLPTWGKWISEATEGRVTLKIEYPGGHPKAMLGNVQDGVFDAAWTFHGYFPGRFKLTKIVELPGLGAGAEAASVAHWRINKKYLHKAGEHKGVILGALFTHGPGQIHLREPIASLKEMDGKKIRIGGGVQTDIANRMGVKGVAAPGSKVYEILSQGVADGVFMPMGEKRTLRLKEVAPFTMKFPTGMYLGSFGVFLNKDFLDSLSAQDRTAVLSVSGEKLSALAGRYWGEDVKVGEADAKASGNTIMEAPASVLKEFEALTEDMEGEWLKSVKDRNVDAKKALMELREIARSYE